jgi:hypothetical protein
MPTNAHYARTVGGTAGTIQRAVSALAEQGALTMTSHGTRGRAVESIDLGRAWAFAGLTPIRLLLPPGGPEEIERLTEALTDDLTAAGIPHTVRHQRGGARRLDSVREGRADVAVLSSGVADTACDLERMHLRHLAPGTYYAPDGLVSVQRAVDRGRVPRRIGIDPDSPDHVALTEATYPRRAGHVYVERPFPDVPAAVLRGEINAGIWHRRHSVIPLDLAGLSTERLPECAREVWAGISGATLVGSGDRSELATVMRSILTERRWAGDGREIGVTAPAEDSRGC